MENKVTITKLAAMIALSTGRQKKLCEDFLKELFAIVEEELVAGGNVRIKGFGTFKLVDVEARKSVDVSTGEDTLIPAHRKVLFVAAKELAAQVNLPFEAFEAVEIADELPTDSLDGSEVPDDELLMNDSESATAEMDYSEECGFACNEDSEEEGFVEPALSKRGAEEEGVAESVLADGSAEEERMDFLTRDAYVGTGGSEHTVDDPGDSCDDGYMAPEVRNNRFAWGFFSGFVAALVCGGIVFAIGYYTGFSFGLSQDKAVAEVVKESSADYKSPEDHKSEDDSRNVYNKADSIDDKTGRKSEDGIITGNDVPTKASDEPVYDTVSTTRYLTTIAKEHYGNFNLWPVIYEENQKFLGHPDRIRPGTKVVVPPLSKYGIDPENVDQIKAVKQKGIEIYARFK